ncbi:MAG: SWIB/MDM2 domain-containing protein [Acidobacteriota bacterium]
MPLFSLSKPRAKSAACGTLRLAHWSCRGDDVAKKAKKKSARKPSAAFMKPMTPSAELSEVVGAKPLPRTEVTKKLWAYIKKNGLQDKKNKRNINADDALKKVFKGKAVVNMFEMTKLVSKHLK